MTIKQVIVSNFDQPKTIVVCVDEGVTDPENGKHYKRCESSIVRLQDTILRDASSQLSLYVNGTTDIENQSKLFSPNAINELSAQMHASIAENWCPGDRLILVGAGRGASVCVETAMLLNRYGIPDRMTTWRNSTGRISHIQYEQCVYKKTGEPINSSSLDVDLMILMDPLSSLVFPPEYTPNTSKNEFKLIKSSSPPPNARRILSLLAIDDHREFFEPMIFSTSPTVTEIWVPGMHEAVVGTGRERLISDTSLSITLKALQENGIKFDSSALEDIQENKSGSGSLGCEGAGNFMARRIRKIKTNQPTENPSEKKNLPLIHISAIERMKHKADYHPESIAALNGEFLVSEF